MHGRVAPTYETGMTRIFYHGRTETVNDTVACLLILLGIPILYRFDLVLQKVLNL